MFVMFFVYCCLFGVSRVKFVACDVTRFVINLLFCSCLWCVCLFGVSQVKFVTCDVTMFVRCFFVL